MRFDLMRLGSDLLTREAIAGYLSRLEDDGVLVMHISNRHMELGRVVAAVGAAEGLVTDSQESQPGRSVAARLQDECHRRSARAVPRASRRSDTAARVDRRSNPIPLSRRGPTITIRRAHHPEQVRPLTTDAIALRRARATCPAPRRPRHFAPPTGRYRRNGARDGSIRRLAPPRQNAQVPPACRRSRRRGRRCP